VAKKLARKIDAFTMPDTPEGVSQFEDSPARAKAPAQPSTNAKVAEWVKITAEESIAARRLQIARPSWIRVTTRPRRWGPSEPRRSDGGPGEKLTRHHYRAPQVQALRAAVPIEGDFKVEVQCTGGILWVSGHILQGAELAGPK
jgi:hypothetical protein